MLTSDILYKVGNNKKILVWSVEVEDNKYRTISGQLEGKKTTSEWTVCYGVNKGKVNATTDGEQAIAEAKSKYDKKIKEGYRTSIKEAKTTAKNTVRPMLAEDFDDSRLPEDFAGYCQPKLDGIRAIGSTEGLASRVGDPIVSCQVIIEQVKEFCDLHKVILDGELYNHSLNNNFNKILSLVKKQNPDKIREHYDEINDNIEYHIFDIIDVSGKKIFSERYQEIKNLLTQSKSNKLFLVDTQETNKLEIDQKYKEYLDAGYEGMMIRFNAPYEQKRTFSLLKLKPNVSKEFTIVDIVEGKGNRAGMAGRIVYQLAPNVTFESGISGGEEFYINLLKDKKKYIGGEGTVKYLNLTPAGVPRCAVTTAVYETKRNL